MQDRHRRNRGCALWLGAFGCSLSTQEAGMRQGWLPARTATGEPSRGRPTSAPKAVRLMICPVRPAHRRANRRKLGKLRIPPCVGRRAPRRSRDGLPARVRRRVAWGGCAGSSPQAECGPSAGSRRPVALRLARKAATVAGPCAPRASRRSPRRVRTARWMRARTGSCARRGRTGDPDRARASGRAGFRPERCPCRLGPGI